MLVSDSSLKTLFCFLSLFLLNQYIGTSGKYSLWFQFVGVTEHALDTKLVSWVILLIVTLACISVDVLGKLFSNMYFPTQTQIHREIQVLDFKKKKREEKRLKRSPDYEEEC